MNASHHLVRLVRRPDGLPAPDDFALVQAPLPRPVAGQVLVRNTHFPDTVGGELLTAAVHAANRGARIALVGALDGQLSPDRAGGSAPAVLDTYRLLTRGITIAGYNGMDHLDVEAEWERRFGHWLRAGDIHFPYTPVSGMERAPAALPELIAGRSFGASIVEL